MRLDNLTRPQAVDLLGEALVQSAERDNAEIAQSGTRWTGHASIPDSDQDRLAEIIGTRTTLVVVYSTDVHADPESATWGIDHYEIA